MKHPDLKSGRKILLNTALNMSYVIKKVRSAPPKAFLKIWVLETSGQSLFFKLWAWFFILNDVINNLLHLDVYHNTEEKIARYFRFIAALNIIYFFRF